MLENKGSEIKIISLPLHIDNQTGMFHIKRTLRLPNIINRSIFNYEYSNKIFFLKITFQKHEVDIPRLFFHYCISDLNRQNSNFVNLLLNIVKESYNQIFTFF